MKIVYWDTIDQLAERGVYSCVVLFIGVFVYIHILRETLLNIKSPIFVYIGKVSFL